MKKLTIGLSVLALAAAGAAVADSKTWSKQDADNNGIVTRAEVQTHSAEMFTRMDANKDGSLSPDDREALKKERRTKMFDAMDVNKNGQISREEFMAFKHDRKRGDGDKMGHRHRMGREGHGGQGMMRMADTNKDGKISQAEFTAASLAHFDRMDSNNDGNVTPEERKAARKAMHDRMQDMTPPQPAE